MKNSNCAHRWVWVHNGARGQRPQPRFNRKTACQHVGQPVEILLRKQSCIIPNQRGLYWLFCLFHSKTRLVFDWFYSNYYCLWSTITTPPMLSLEMNESSDFTAFNWTTLKWKLPKKKCQFDAYMKWIPLSSTYVEISHTGTLFLSWGGEAQLQNIRVLMFISEPGIPAEFCH